MADEKIQINKLTEETIIPLTDFVPVDLAVGGGLYTPRKVTRANILRQAELPAATEILSGDTLMLERVVDDVPTLLKVSHSLLTSRLFVQTTGATSSGAAIQSSILGAGAGSKVVPDSFLTVKGRGLSYEAYGEMGTFDVTPGTGIIRFYLDDNVVAQLTFDVPPNLDANVYRLVMRTHALASGNSPQQHSIIDLTIATTAGASAHYMAFMNPLFAVNSAMELDVTFEPSVDTAMSQTSSQFDLITLP